MSTTGRQDVVSGLLSVLNTYKGSNPSLLRRTWTARPGTFGGELPLAFITMGDETVVHTSGTRQRTFVPQVTVVDTFADNEQTAGRLDILVDGLMDAFTAAPHAVSGAVIRVTQVSTGDLEQLGPSGPIFYRSATFVFAETVLMEGRN